MAAPPSTLESTVPLSSLAIPHRPPKNSLLQTTLFSIYFTLSCIFLHIFQCMIQPMRIFPPLRPSYRALNAWCKASFAKGLVSMTCE